MQLAGANAEQAWIAERIAAGVDCPQGVVVTYPEPSIIYGRRGHSDGAIPARALKAGIEVQQRRTGGGAVLAGPWLLSVDLLLPPTHALSQMGHVAAFLSLGESFRDALLALGVSCAMANESQIARHNADARKLGLEWVCFAGLSHGELIDKHGRKLLGLAQGRGPWGSLLSIGLLLSQTPWETLETIHLGRPCAQCKMHQQASEGLASLVPEVSTDIFRRAMMSAVAPHLRPKTIGTQCSGHAAQRNHNAAIVTFDIQPPESSDELTTAFALV